MPAQRVAIALGSNLGNRVAHLAHGRERLASLLSDFTCSQPIETEPVGVGPQPPFLNAAASGWTVLSPSALLRSLLVIEEERGRTRITPGAARTLDLDLILFGDVVLTEPDLQLPHPRFRDRLFVLRPLAEIAPEMIDPVTGLSVAALLDRLAQK